MTEKEKMLNSQMYNPMGDKQLRNERCSVKNLCREYSGTDDGITVTVEKTGEGAAPALHPVSLQKTVFFLMNLPNGVQKMSGQIPGLVETSLNLGILKLEPDHLHACASVRSSVGSAKEALSDKLEYLIGFLGGEFHVEGAYPAWEYKEDSALRDLMVAEYEAMYGQKPAVEAIHAGLECGIRLGDFNEYEAGDIIECYTLEKIQQTL